MKVTILCDQLDSFFLNYIDRVIQLVLEEGHEITFVNDVSNLIKGDILFLAAAKSILNDDQISLNKYNVVIHPSKLPHYRGSGVLAWSILDGANSVWVSSFIATKVIDGGPILLQTEKTLNGDELNNELRSIQAEMYIFHILDFLRNPREKGIPTTGKSSKIYRRRTPKDSELDIDLSIAEQFNILRVVDNERYPAYFEFQGNKYVIKITKEISME